MNASISFERARGTQAALPGIALLFCFAVCCSPAPAQEPAADDGAGEAAAAAPAGFTQMQVTGSVAQAQRAALAMLRSGTVSDAAAIETYYGSILAAFTVPASMPDAYDNRKTIRRHARQAYSKAPKQLHTTLNNFILTTLTPTIADSQYHPAARYNWTLLIGDLNERELPLQGAGNEAALPAAVPVLIGAIENPEQIDAVRIAALIGLERHARLDGLAGDAVVPVLSALFTAPRPESRSEDVHAWILERAAGVLTLLNAEVPGGPGNADDAPDAPDTPAADDVPGGPDTPDVP